MKKNDLYEGNILRVKAGYNPNSSSVGSVVYALPTAVLAVPVLFGAVNAVVLSNINKLDSSKKNTDEASSEVEEDR